MPTCSLSQHQLGINKWNWITCYLVLCTRASLVHVTRNKSFLNHSCGGLMQLYMITYYRNKSHNELSLIMKETRMSYFFILINSNLPCLVNWCPWHISYSTPNSSKRRYCQGSHLWPTILVYMLTLKPFHFGHVDGCILWWTKFF